MLSSDQWDRPILSRQKIHQIGDFTEDTSVVVDMRVVDKWMVIMEVADLVVVEKEVIALKVVDFMVVIVVDLGVEVVEKDQLINDHFRFGTYHRPNFDHQF